MAKPDTEHRGGKSGNGQTAPPGTNLEWDLSRWPGQAAVDTWLDMVDEMSAFVARRVHEDLQAQHRMLHSHSPKELQRIQAEFMQKAVEDYQKETSRLAEIARKLRPTDTES